MFEGVSVWLHLGWDTGETAQLEVEIEFVQRHLDLDRGWSVLLKLAAFEVKPALAWGWGRGMLAQPKVMELRSLHHCQSAVALVVMRQQVEWK